MKKTSSIIRNKDTSLPAQAPKLYCSTARLLLSLLLWVTESELMYLASLSNTDQRYLLHFVLFSPVISPEAISSEQAGVGRT